MMPIVTAGRHVRWNARNLEFWTGPAQA